MVRYLLGLKAARALLSCRSRRGTPHDAAVGADDTALRLSDDVPVTDSARAYSDDQRHHQLIQLAGLRAALSEALGSHGEPWQASLFQERAVLANHLDSAGWDPESLSAVRAPFPSRPDWLHLKAEAPREPWHGEVAVLHAKAPRLALELWGGTYD